MFRADKPQKYFIVNPYRHVQAPLVRVPPVCAPLLERPRLVLCAPLARTSRDTRGSPHRTTTTTAQHLEYYSSSWSWEDRETRCPSALCQDASSARNITPAAIFHVYTEEADRVRVNAWDPKWDLIFRELKPTKCPQVCEWVCQDLQPGRV